MPVVANDLRVKAVAEEMAGAVVPAVEPLGVGAVDEPHPGGERVATALDDDVEVIVHDAVRLDAPPVPSSRAEEPANECAPIGVVEHDRAAGDAARRDVEDAFVRESAAREARHGRDGSGGAARPIGSEPTFHTLDTAWGLSPRP
jgi:hypothetical protein